jgi:drug/metabolite transporter (DMT)-like permease
MRERFWIALILAIAGVIAAIIILAGGHSNELGHPFYAFGLGLIVICLTVWVTLAVTQGLVKAFQWGDESRGAIAGWLLCVFVTIPVGLAVMTFVANEFLNW